MLTRPRDVRERRRHARDQGPVEAGKRADRLVVNGVPRADVTRRRGNNRDQQGFPLTERWEGSRDWKPDMLRGSYRPDRLIIDRPGKCEVRCEQSGREYRGREYRC